MPATHQTEQEQHLAKAIAGRAGAMLDDLRTYVAIPTGKNHTPGLDEFRGIVTGRLQAIGAIVETIPGESKPAWLSPAAVGGVATAPPTVVCQGPSASGTRILLASHLDTVFDPASSFRELTIAPDGKTATGPGVVDMKGGIVIALHALEALAEIGNEVAWSYLFNSDEETGSYHSATALRALAPKYDVGLATEPAMPGGELAIERSGSGQFMLEAFGKSSHVGRDFTAGVSAVTALAKALVRVAEFPEPARGRILSVGPLRGGDATNAVPEYAAAWGNVRFPTQAIADELAELLDALPAELGMDGDGEPRLAVRRSFDNRPAKPLIPETKQLADLAAVTAGDLGQELPFASTGGVCDGNILQAAGLPTIDTLGVRGGGLHTTDEWIELPSLVERCTLLATLLARLSVSDAFQRAQ